MLPKLSVTLALLIALSACHVTRAYSGPARGSEEIAVLYPQGVILRRVNAQRIDGMSSGVEVLPGETEIELAIDPSNYNDLTHPGQTYLLKMQAAPGASYIITSNKNGGVPCAWEMNQDSGQPDYLRSMGCATRETSAQEQTQGSAPRADSPALVR